MSGGQDGSSKNAHIEVPSKPANSSHNTASLVFNGMNAVGALLLAILAIFGDRIRAWLAKPIIEIDCGRDIPFIEEIKVQSNSTS